MTHLLSYALKGTNFLFLFTSHSAKMASVCCYDHNVNISYHVVAGSENMILGFYYLLISLLLKDLLTCTFLEK